MYIVQLSIAHALIGLLLAVLWVFQDSDSFGRDVLASLLISHIRNTRHATRTRDYSNITASTRHMVVVTLPDTFI